MNNFNFGNGKNINPNELKKAVEQGKTEDFINKNLSPEASKKLKEVMQDKNAMEKILSSNEAKELLNKLLNR